MRCKDCKNWDSVTLKANEGICLRYTTKEDVKSNTHAHVVDTDVPKEVHKPLMITGRNFGCQNFLRNEEPTD